MFDDIINYLTFIFTFESGKCEKAEEKLQKIESVEQIELFRWNKKKSQFLRDYQMVKKQKFDKK